MPASSSRTALRWRVKLLEVPYPMWREQAIEAGSTFWERHGAIQHAFGWNDSHIHSFRLPRPGRRPIENGMPEKSGFATGPRPLADWKFPLSQHSFAAGGRSSNVYDFGDEWEHEPIFLDEFRWPGRRKLPACLGGNGHCPPDDVAGPGASSRSSRRWPTRSIRSTGRSSPGAATASTRPTSRRRR